MSKLRPLIFLLFIASFSAEAYCQKILAFDKRGREKRVRYYVGDEIDLKLLDKTKISGVILQLDSSSFNVDGEKIALNKVKYVYRRNTRYGLNILSKMSLIAGVGYFSLDVINRVINDEQPAATQESIHIGAGLVGLSLLSGSLSGRRFKIGENRPLKILDLRL